MTESGAAWATPLLLLPGVALILVATVHRFSQLQERLHEFGPEHPSREFLRTRARLFHWAFIGQYAGIASFLAASLLGGVISLAGGPGATVAYSAAGIGIIFVFVAIVLLVLEVVELADHPPLIDLDPEHRASPEEDGRPDEVEDSN